MRNGLARSHMEETKMPWLGGCVGHQPVDDDHQIKNSA
jgi:hypothetical protein